MELSKLWDPQVLIYVGLTCATVIIALVVLAITTRRVPYLMSEVQSLRKEMKMLEEGVQMVSRYLELAAGSTKEGKDTAGES